jgi:hypothetical protein
MPYVFRNRLSKVRLENGKFVEYSQWLKLVDVVRMTDPTVVESRRETRAVILEAMNSAFTGSSLFSTDQRFPEEEVFVFLGDQSIQRAMNSLVTNLAQRQTNIAKDISGPRMGSDRHFEVSEQGSQDTFKQFVELVNTLDAASASDKLLWDRTNFESRASASWRNA